MTEKYESVEIELSTEAIAEIALMAHEEDITFNQKCINIIVEQIEKDEQKNIISKILDWVHKTEHLLEPKFKMVGIVLGKKEYKYLMNNINESKLLRPSDDLNINKNTLIRQELFGKELLQSSKERCMEAIVEEKK